MSNIVQFREPDEPAWPLSENRMELVQVMAHLPRAFGLGDAEFALGALYSSIELERADAMEWLEERLRARYRLRLAIMPAPEARVRARRLRLRVAKQDN